MKKLKYSHLVSKLESILIENYKVLPGTQTCGLSHPADSIPHNSHCIFGEVHSPPFSLARSHENHTVSGTLGNQNALGFFKF